MIVPIAAFFPLSSYGHLCTAEYPIGTATRSSGELFRRSPTAIPPHYSQANPTPATVHIRKSPSMTEQAGNGEADLR